MAIQLKNKFYRLIDQEARSQFKYWLFLTAVILLILSNCNESFQPLKENDTFFFSIQGYLDASADTQWVRVGTIRPTIDEVPNAAGIKVTLKDLESGETVVMSDSVFTIRNVLNYWTTYEIKHEHAYEITAEHADGNTSRVTMTTPAELPSFYIIPMGGFAGVRILIEDSVEHIADLQSVWYVILNPGTENRRRIYTFPFRNTLTHTRGFGGSYTAFVNWERELEQIEQNVGVSTTISVAYRQIFVAVGGPEWDENISSIADFEYFIAGNTSNVKNGLGYVVGVSTKWFRQSICETPDGSNYAPCETEERYWYHEFENNGNF